MNDRRTGEAGVAEIALRLARDAEIPVLVLNPRRKGVEAVNSMFLETFGWEAEDLLGERYASFVAEEDRAVFRNLLSITAYGGSQEPEDVQFLSPGSGDDVDVSVIGVPNVLEDPTSPVAVLCRPQGKTVGRPIPPPEIFTTDGHGLDRIPPRKRIKEDRQMNETSRNLWG